MSIPVYRRVAFDLKQKILSGQYPPGTLLPPAALEDALLPEEAVSDHSASFSTMISFFSPFSAAFNMASYNSRA